MFGKKDPSKSPRHTGGPVVKTGPTRGENRSRNRDGQWRKKRSDTGSSKKGGCYITTAACEYMGLPDDCYELRTLRHFRDQVLLRSATGRRLVHEYYTVAPGIAEELRGSAEMKSVWDVIQNCVRAVEENRTQDAISLYRAMTEDLLRKCRPSSAP